MMSFVPPPIVPFTEEEKEILELSLCARVKIMTFNIKFDCRKTNTFERPWVLRFPSVHAMLTEERPHVVCTQEALAHQVASFATDYVCMGEGRNGGVKSEFCAVIANRRTTSAGRSGTFWLSETPRIPCTKVSTSKYNRIATWAFVSVPADPGARFLVVSTHTCHASSQARAEQVRVLCEEVDDVWAREAGRGCPVVVCGDFNEGKVSERGPYTEYSMLREAGFRDAWREAREERAYHGYSASSCHHWSPVFDAQDAAPPTDARHIDWVMWKDGLGSFFECGVNQHLVPMKAEILARKYCGAYPSDHFPVAVTFASVPTLESLEQ